jgi:hypothetical protein
MILKKHLAKVFLILCLFAIVAIPAQAALINVSLIKDWQTTAQTTDITYGGYKIPVFVKNIPSGYGLQDLRVYIPNKDDPILISFTQYNNNVITADITKRTTGLFEDTVTVHIAGGTSSTETYATFFSVISLAPTYRCFYLQSNTTPKTYYLAIVNSNAFLFQEDYLYDLDDTTDAFIVLSARPSLNPIKSFTVVSSLGNELSGVYSYGTLANIKAGEDKPGSGYSPGILGIWERLIDAVLLTYNTLATFASLIASFYAFIYSGAAFIFAAKVLLTIVAAYTIINAVLSVHDNDNLFSAISKFMRREMKLFRFFMDIFKWIKDIIKWW